MGEGGGGTVVDCEWWVGGCKDEAGSETSWCQEAGDGRSWWEAGDGMRWWEEGVVWVFLWLFVMLTKPLNVNNHT